MTFGELLRLTRRARGLNQHDLARRAGTTQTYVSRVERGVVSPSEQTMRRLLAAMAMELEVSARPVSAGNERPARLRADFESLSAEERVEQAMEVSDFLVAVAEGAGHEPR